ncbi:MAG: Ger(x)C family spore germination protein [Clostridia bacterium]|nr:Ger(x)C family spore germination protein [Clostridia bacterium]
MKKIICILLLPCLLTALLSACVGNYELSRELLVEAAGIDLEDGNVIVTAQVLNTESYPSGDSGSSDGDVTSVYTVEGQTVKDAVEKLAVLTGKNPVFSQNRILILGKSLWETKDPVTYIDFFQRTYQSRNNVYIAAAREKAAEIAGARIGSGKIPAIRAERVIEAGGKCGLSIAVRLYEYINMYTNPAKGEYLPLLASTNGDNEDETIIVADGLMVSRNGRFRTLLDRQETETLALITSHIRNGSITASAAQKTFSLEIITSKQSIKTAAVADQPTVTVNIRCSCDVADLFDDSRGLSSEAIEATARATEQTIETAARGLIEKLLTRDGCDIFGFSDKFLKHDTDFFLAHAGRDRDHTEIWEQQLKAATVSVTADVKIRRIGQDTVRKN